MSMTFPAGNKDGDFDAIHDAVMETARGRWFLSEYGRRQRKTEIDRLLRATERLEKLAEENKRAQEAARSRQAAIKKTDLDDEKPPRPFLLDLENGDGLESALRRELTNIYKRLSELCWSLRERGFEDALCSELHRLGNAMRICLARGDAAKGFKAKKEEIAFPTQKAVFYPLPAKEAKMPREYAFIDGQETSMPKWAEIKPNFPLRRPLNEEQADNSSAKERISKERALAALDRLEKLPLMEKLLLFC